MMKKRIVIGIMVLLISGLLTGCTGTKKTGEKPVAENNEITVDNKVINIKGSDTMVYLSKAMAEAFMEKNQDTQLAVVGGGSGTGIKALTVGTTDIANASRKMKPAEIEEAISKGIEPKEFIIALDGLAIVVNKDNPVTQLNIEQLRDIFTGKIINWQEVDGKNEAIKIISREANSGTHDYFKEHVLKDAPFSANTFFVQTSRAETEETAKQKTAIGYVGIGDAKANKDVKILKIALKPGAEALDPSNENVKSGDYPISRSLYLYTAGEPLGHIKSFVDFTLSREGQQIVEEQGFIPIK